MKKFWFKPGFVAMAGVLSLAVLFSACKKNNESQSLPVAGLMVFNLAPDKNQTGFSLSGNTLTYSPLGYSSYTGYYLNVYPGTRAVESYDQTGSVASSTVSFETDKYYSAFLLGANGNYRNLVVQDNIDTLTAPNGVAYVRYINAIPDSSKPQVTLTADGNTLFNSPAGFATVSGFAAVSPGDVTINLSNEGTINASRTITLEPRKVYTVLLQGIPGHAEQERNVQIKFIANGQVNP
jgi:hypothetical protein